MRTYKQKVILFYKIINVINESYPAKIKVDEIYFVGRFRDNKHVGAYNKKRRHIAIRARISWERQGYTFIHELVHAFQHYKKIPLGHDKYFYAVEEDFLKILGVY